MKNKLIYKNVNTKMFAMQKCFKMQKRNSIFNEHCLLKNVTRDFIIFAECVQMRIHHSFFFRFLSNNSILNYTRNNIHFSLIQFNTRNCWSFKVFTTSICTGWPFANPLLKIFLVFFRLVRSPFLFISGSLSWQNTYRMQMFR